MSLDITRPTDSPLKHRIYWDRQATASGPDKPARLTAWINPLTCDGSENMLAEYSSNGKWGADAHWQALPQSAEVFCRAALSSTTELDDILAAFGFPRPKSFCYDRIGKGIAHASTDRLCFIAPRDCSRIKAGENGWQLGDKTYWHHVGFHIGKRGPEPSNFDSDIQFWKSIIARNLLARTRVALAMKIPAGKPAFKITEVIRQRGGIHQHAVSYRKVSQGRGFMLQLLKQYDEIMEWLGFPAAVAYSFDFWCERNTQHRISINPPGSGVSTCTSEGCWSAKSRHRWQIRFQTFPLESNVERLAQTTSESTHELRAYNHVISCLLNALSSFNAALGEPGLLTGAEVAIESTLIGLAGAFNQG